MQPEESTQTPDRMGVAISAAERALAAYRDAYEAWAHAPPLPAAERARLRREVVRTLADARDAMLALEAVLGTAEADTD